MLAVRHHATNLQNAVTTAVVMSATVLTDTNSCPAPWTATSSVVAGMSFNAAVSSSIEPNPSRRPCTKSAGVLRFGKCSVRSCSGFLGG